MAISTRHIFTSKHTLFPKPPSSLSFFQPETGHCQRHVVRKHWHMQIGEAGLKDHQAAGGGHRTSHHNTVLRPAQPIILLQECEIASGEVDCDNRWGLEQILCEEACPTLGCGELYAAVVLSLEFFLMLD